MSTPNLTTTLTGRRALTLAALVALLLAAAGCDGNGSAPADEGSAAESGEADSVQQVVTLTPAQRANVDIVTVPVEQRPVGEPLDLPGRVVPLPDQVALVTSLVAGRIEAVSVNTGDRVRAGQPVARIASPELGTLAADLQRARTELNLQERLTERGVGTPQQLADAQATYTAARQGLRSIGLSAARIDALASGGGDTGSLPLVAPISGVVLERTATQGGPVASGEQLFRIVDLTPILVEADAYESDLRRLREGLPVEIVAASDTLLRRSARIDQIVPQVDPTRRTAVVRMRVSNSDRSLTPGMFATVRVEAASEEQPAVPARALQLSGSETFVLVAENDSTFRRQDVSASADAAGSGFVPVPELALGTRVVTEGALQIVSVMTGVEADDD